MLTMFTDSVKCDCKNLLLWFFNLPSKLKHIYIWTKVARISSLNNKNIVPKKQPLKLQSCAQLNTTPNRQFLTGIEENTSFVTREKTSLFMAIQIRHHQHLEQNCDAYTWITFTLLAQLMLCPCVLRGIALQLFQMWRLSGFQTLHPCCASGITKHQTRGTLEAVMFSQAVVLAFVRPFGKTYCQLQGKCASPNVSNSLEEDLRKKRLEAFLKLAAFPTCTRCVGERPQTLSSMLPQLCLIFWETIWFFPPRNSISWLEMAEKQKTHTECMFIISKTNKQMLMNSSCLIFKTSQRSKDCIRWSIKGTGW